MPNKQHPKEVILIEEAPEDMWKVVARETTNTGLERGPMPELARYHMIEAARGMLEVFKRGLKI